MHLEICKLRALRPSFLQFRGTIRTLAKPFELSPFYRMAVRVRNLSRSREHSSSLGRGGRGIGCGVPIKDLDFAQGCGHGQNFHVREVPSCGWPLGSLHVFSTPIWLYIYMYIYIVIYSLL